MEKPTLELVEAEKIRRVGNGSVRFLDGAPGCTPRYIQFISNSAHFLFRSFPFLEELGYMSDDASHLYLCSFLV